MHQQLDRKRSDHHIVNPNCRSNDQDEGCEAEEHHVILASGLSFGEKLHGACSELVVSPDLFADAGDEKWSAGNAVGMDYLYGSITIECQEGPTGDPQLAVLDYTCHEFLPFSVINEHDNSPESGAQPEWTRAGALPLEFRNYRCGEAPSSLVVSSRTVNAQTPAAAYALAVAACAELPECRAVSLQPNARKFKVDLLKGFICRPSHDVQPAAFASDARVRWWAPPGENPSHEVGTVLRLWTLHSDEDSVEVEFPTLGVRKIPPDSLELEVEDRAAGSLVALKVRARSVQCDALSAGYSCDISRRSDAFVLFNDAMKSVKDCEQLCASAAQNISLFSGCCVFSDGICALTRGEHFKMVVDAVGGEDGRYPQKRMNKDREAEEAAGRCDEVPCMLDAACRMGARRDFAAPPNVPVEAGHVTLYFDFAHPLTMPFIRQAGWSQPNIFHFTSEDPAAQEAVSGASRMVRAIGSVNKGSAVLDAKRSTRDKVTILRSRASTSRKELQRAQAALDQVCDEHGAAFVRTLVAPSLLSALSAREECLAEHSSAEAPGFEPCLVSAGCRAISAEADFLPFAGPWFSKLPFDVMAWQQPAPFCCSVPFTSRHRSEFLRAKLFRTVGLQDAQMASLQLVDDATVRDSMAKSLHDGSAAMRALLAKGAHDPGMLTWLSLFLVQAERALGKFMQEIREMVSLEGDDDEDELSENATSFLRIHEHGNVIAPSGRRAFEVARWSEERGAFIQRSDPHGDDGLPPGKPRGVPATIGHALKLVPGAIYNHGIKPIWNFLVGPLATWGMSLTSWIVGHPRAALFISKLALGMRNRLCEKASLWAYGDPGMEAVGAFTKMAETAGRGAEYLQQTFSPATVLVGLQKALANDNFLQKMSSLGKAAFAITLSWAGFATGGAGAMLIGSVVSLFTDAAIDASKQALELMVYQEIAKEIPSNLFDMVMSKCLYKRSARRVVAAQASVEEVATASREAVAQVTRQVAVKGRSLAAAMDKLVQLSTSGAGPHPVGPPKEPEWWDEASLLEEAEVAPKPRGRRRTRAFTRDRGGAA